MRYLKRTSNLAIFIFFWASFVCAQFQIPDIPKKQTSVYDDTSVNLLSNTQEKALEQKLIRYSDSTSTQIVIAIISTTKGEDINFLGAQWGQKWGIGQDKKDNGILLLVAKDDRKIAISTGYGVEGSLTDLMCKRIIENVILPQFRQSNFYNGLNKGTDAIFQVLNGEFNEDRDFSSQNSFSLSNYLPFIIFFVILIILSNRNRRNGGGKNNGRKRGLDIWDAIILSNMGRSGGSKGSFGGGGFSGGFGGGGFGGGGASGGW